MSYCEDSNINKSYIVQNVESSDIFSACTEIYLTNITPCTGDTININSNLNVTGDISGTTFYGDGSKLSGIITTDNYVTGGVYTASTKSLYFTGTTGFTPFSVDVSALLDDTNSYVTGGTYNPSTDTISLFRNDNVTIDITGVTDTFTTGGTYDNGTSLITFVKNDNTSYTVDLSSIDVNDTFVTGSTLNGDALTIRRNDGVDIIVTGFSQTFTGNTSGTCIGDIYVSNIHSCSPLRINPNDEGNVYFGSTSGITIDVINQRVGIGTNSPTEALVVSGNTIVGGTLNIGKLGTNPSINNLGIDSIGNVVVGTTGDTDTNTFVTGGTLSSNDLILEKNNGVDVNPINLSGLVSGKTDLTLFNSHTGDTNNPHQTSFSGLTSTAHTHTLSEITDFNTYSGNVQTQLDGKVETILFNSHTGDTNNPHDTSFSNLISTAHTHTISDVINLQNELDGKLNVSEFNTYSGDVQTQIDSKLDTSIFNSYTGSVVDVFVSSGNANSVTQQLSFTNTTGGTFNVTNSAALFSDNDVNVTGGTYNPSNGCVTFTTNSGTTFDVCGFVTGITDTFVTGGTLSGTDLILERSNGIDVSGIDLSSLISGKLDITTFNTYTGDTQTILNSKTDNTDFTSHTGDTTIHYTKSSINLSDLGNSAHTHTINEVIDLQSKLDSKTDLTLFDTHTGDTNNPHQTSFSNLTSTAHTHSISDIINLQTELDDKTDNIDFTSHTGDTAIHFTKSSINLSDLGSSAHTHTLNEITDFNSYSGSVQTQLDTKIENGVNSGGANEVFSGKSGTDLQFRTISGGSNTIVTTVGNVVKIDSTGGGDNFYVTGGTFSSETLTLDRNDGGSVVVTGFTSGGGDNFYVTGFTYNDANTLKISQNGGLSDLTSTINTMTGLTVNGTLIVDTISATTINGSVTGLTLNDLDDVTTGIPTTPGNEYQGRQIYFDVASNEWISTQEYGSIGTVTIWGKKGTAGTIDKGCPVYITGFDDDIHQVELANATTATTMPVIGFTGEDFDNTTTNPIITFGKISGLDTTSTISTLNPNGETWAVNDVLYMNTTDGGLTKNRPSGTNTQIQRIAKVLKVGATSGQLFIFNTARTAGLPNLTTDYVWLGNGNDTPQEVIKTNLGVSVTGFSYDDNNTFTITDDNSGSYTSTINQVSGLTINGDLDVTGDVGIGTTPSSILDVEGSKGRLRLRLDDENGVSNAVNQLFLTSEEATYTNYISIGTTTLNAELQFGIIGPSSTSTRVGITDDAFILATSAADNMNFINNKGTGTSDNIGFYAGKAVTDDLSSVTPDIIILGDGANIGNVGIGTATPTEKLEVSGNTVISGTLNIGTIGGGTPIGNLGFDSNGQVVTGTTGGGTGVSDANKIFSWFMTV